MESSRSVEEVYNDLENIDEHAQPEELLKEVQALLKTAPKSVELKKLKMLYKSTQRKFTAETSAKKNVSVNTDQEEFDELWKLFENLEVTKALIPQMETLVFRTMRAIDLGTELPLERGEKARKLGHLRAIRHQLLGIKKTSVGGGKKIGRQNDIDTKEFFDEGEELEQKISALTELIKNSKHMICFTGAGISTSTGIPDFRSGADTVNKTGAGAWTRRDARMEGKMLAPTRGAKISTLSAIPSPSHMFLVELQNRGTLKYCVSQNTDGLHRRSGIKPSQLSEMHGNGNLDRCPKCKLEFMRDFKVRSRKHMTGRKCPVCKTALRDSIINFKEPMPAEPLDKGLDHAEKSDLCLVLGTSCMVYPAAKIPGHVGSRKGDDLVIINLQKTPLDGLCSIRIFQTIDRVIEGVAERMKMMIPPFELCREVECERVPVDDENDRLVLQTFDGSTPIELLDSLKLDCGTVVTAGDARAPKPEAAPAPSAASSDMLTQLKNFVSGGPPVADDAPPGASGASPVSSGGHKFEYLVPKGKEVAATLSFFGHYGEPDANLTLSSEPGKIRYQLRHIPGTATWNIQP